MISTETLQKDELLVIEYQHTQDAKVFGQLYELFYQKLYLYTLSIVKNSDDAFDITQETFIHASTEVLKLRSPITFRFWLFKIAKHKALKLQRKVSKESTDSYDLDFAEQDYSTSEAIDKDAAIETMNTLVAALSTEDQMLMSLRYTESRSIQDIVTHTGLGSSAVKMKLMRARQKVSAGFDYVG